MSTADSVAPSGSSLVSVIIPAARWDSRLEATLGTVRAQRLPEGVAVEVAIAIGEGAADVEAPPGVTIVDNPGGSIPIGLNRAVAATTGEVVVRVDSRCHLASDHVERVLEDLADPAVGCVGGAQLVLDRGLFGSVYAIAFNGGLLGPTPYRCRRTSGPVDTAYLGAWRRRTLLEVGGFDERLARNQDNELADRIRAHGLIVWYDADLVVGYWNDRDLRGAMSHHRDFGRWRTLQAGHGQRALTRRHVAVLGAGGVGAALLGGTALHPQARRLGAAAVIAGYAAAARVASRSARRMRAARPDIEGAPLDPIASVLAPGAATIIDAAWAWGLVEPRMRRAGGRARPAQGRDA